MLNDARCSTALPSGSIGLQTLAYVTPGFASTQADVGGTRDTWSAQGAYTFFHGKTGTRASFDGFRNQYFIGAGNGVGYISDSGTIQELQLETSGMGAESGSGSASLNAIPKSGGNIFSGGIDGFFSATGCRARTSTTTSGRSASTRAPKCRRSTGSAPSWAARS